jgi:hypothetical protein
VHPRALGATDKAVHLRLVMKNAVASGDGCSGSIVRHSSQARVPAVGRDPSERYGIVPRDATVAPSPEIITTKERHLGNGFRHIASLGIP